MDVLTKQKYIFASLFMLSNRLQVMGDRVMADGLTIRQWLLTVAIAKYGSIHPTICETAKLMGTSRQSIKELALRLKQKGFLNIEKYENDFRKNKLVLTNKYYYFCDREQAYIIAFLRDLFTELEKEEIDCLYDFIHKMHDSAIGLGSKHCIAE